jgi:hypothetical protein
VQLLSQNGWRCGHQQPSGTGSGPAVTANAGARYREDSSRDASNPPVRRRHREVTRYALHGTAVLASRGKGQSMGIHVRGCRVLGGGSRPERSSGGMVDQQGEIDHRRLMLSAQLDDHHARSGRFARQQQGLLAAATPAATWQEQDPRLSPDRSLPRELRGLGPLSRAQRHGAQAMRADGGFDYGPVTPDCRIRIGGGLNPRASRARWRSPSRLPCSGTRKQWG